MWYLSRSVIPISMMVAISAVAGKPAHAQHNEYGGPAPVPGPGDSYGAPAPVYTPYLPAPPAEQPQPAPLARPVDQAQPVDQARPVDQVQPADQAPPARKGRPESVEGAPADAPEPAKFGGPAQKSHHLQTGLSLMSGTGYRLIARYTERQYCADSSGEGGKPVCSRRLPTFLDVQLSFGALARMDAILDLRFGLEEDPAVAGGHQFVIAPGLRFWLDRERSAKFYTTLQFVYDYTDFSSSPDVPSHDFGLRNANGFMYDPIRNVGVFLQFGETIGLRRWFRIDVEVGLGAQIRFP